LKTTNKKTIPLLTLTAPGRVRIPNASETAIPIYVIGGFLGSGKTTLLGRLLRHVVQSGGKPAVLMNELSEISVDGALLHDHAADRAFEVRAILHRCVCCDQSQELEEEIKSLLHSSEGPVFVETTELVPVGQVAEVISRALRAGARRGQLASVIAVVDARRFALPRGDDHDPTVEISGADTVILNKVDGVPDQAVGAGEARIRARNPAARIFHATFADVDPLEILSANRAPFEATASDADENVAPPSVADYETVSAKLLGPVHIDRLTRLFARHEHKLARVKGFVRLAGAWGFQKLQWVPRSREIEVEPRRKPQGVRSHLVIIGRDMDWDAFATDLDGCVDLDPTQCWGPA